MPLSARFAALKRWLWLLNRRRLHRREMARHISYSQWCARFDTLGEAELKALHERLATLPQSPLVALRLHLAPSARCTPQALATTLRSLQAQMYGHWQLTLTGLGDADTGDAGLAAWARSACAAEARVSWVSSPVSAQPLGQPLGELLGPNESAPQQPAWFADLNPGDVWRPHALLLLLEGALHQPAAQMVYADHDGGTSESRHSPAFKCDWNEALLWSHDYLGSPVLWCAQRFHAVDGACKLSAHARTLLRSRGLREGQVVHVPHVLLHQAEGDTPIACDAPAVQSHLRQLGHQVSCSVQRFGAQVRLADLQPPPKVSIVIPTRNGLDLLRTCITSVLQKTSYANFDITVVDNGSDDPACLSYLHDLAQSGRVKVLRDERPFNFSQLNNGAVAQCDGEFVVLLNNDIEVIAADWLREMVSLAALPGVGAVGARLLYGDRSVQHAGVILGIGGGAGHVHKRLAESEGGYLGRGLQMQTLSAVTAACLVVRRAHYLAVGGLDEASFAVAFNDIDFCLRLRAIGLRTLYTPHAVLLHHESVSRGKDNRADKRPRFEAERARFVQRWGPLLSKDPAYNPNLTLSSESFALADPPRVTLLKPWYASDALPTDSAEPTRAAA
jgi:O-antigen biosynthesis protein